MDVDEYIEKLVADAYRREGEQEENVARSLPFFAASLAVLATVLGLVRAVLPPIELSTYSIISYGCLIGIAAAVILVIWHLGIAVWPRRFEYLMSESDLRAYTDQLREFYSHTHANSDDIEAAVLDDLRTSMIEQYAKGAMQNRANNVARTRARSFALTALVVALGFAFGLIGAILMNDIFVKGDGRHGPKSAATDRASPEVGCGARQHDGPVCPQAANPAHAHCDQGRMGLA